MITMEPEEDYPCDNCLGGDCDNCLKVEDWFDEFSDDPDDYDEPHDEDIEGESMSLEEFLGIEEPEFPHKFKSHLCTLCGESCFTPCELLLEYERLQDKLEHERMFTSRTQRRMIQQQLYDIEQEVQD